MRAYNEDYLPFAMKQMGYMFDYVAYDLEMDLEEFWIAFIASTAGRGFERGNPKYVAGMSGIELAWHVLEEKMGSVEYIEPTMPLEKSREYWAGWVMAYYQNYRNMTFLQMHQCGITPNRVIGMYILHEADISKFVEVADGIVAENSIDENRLKRFRKYAKLTQKMLSEKSGVSLRMIQLYEQGQNDLAKAQVSVVMALAQVLNCDVKDLVG